MQSFVLRTLDIFLSLTGLIISLPLLLLIYIAGLIESGSPIFSQQRIGRFQQAFTLYKFRTMAVNTGSVGTHLVDTASITRLGRFLRRTKLDELPQLINVLLGHMSLVGPRPCLPNQTELVAERDKRGIFEERPGITGLAQVNKVDMSNPRKLARYDAILINHLTTSLYFRLIIATAFGKGAGDRINSS
jgi:O-antigen biosynthesis protein WbqP